jgi:hypothetical protein
LGFGSASCRSGDARYSWATVITQGSHRCVAARGHHGVSLPYGGSETASILQISPVSVTT